MSVNKFGGGGSTIFSCSTFVSVAFVNSIESTRIFVVLSAILLKYSTSVANGLLVRLSCFGEKKKRKLTFVD